MSDNNVFEIVVGGETRLSVLTVTGCNKIPTDYPDPFGNCKYYRFRFEDFLNRHITCSHEPPVYYFGPLQKKSSTPYLGKSIDTTKEWWSTLVNTEPLKPPYPAYRKGTPIVRESYGFKYCVVFSASLMPKLSKDGQKWLTRARENLQMYMENGVIKGKFTSSFDHDFNKQLANRSLKDVELDNNWFQRFAFATHPDAYIDAGLIQVSIPDKLEISLTPDFKEWVNTGTWYQAWLVGKEQLKQWKKDTMGYGGKKYDEAKEYLEKKWMEGEKEAKKLLDEINSWF